MSSALTVVELKELCRLKNLSEAGTKAELMKRLLDAGFTEESLQAAASKGASDRAADVEPQRVMHSTIEEKDRPLSEVELLRRETERAQEEIRRLQRELQRAGITLPSENRSSVRHREIKWTDLKEMVGDFDGGNYEVDTWTQQIKKLIDANGLEEQEAKALVCHKLKGTAIKWYHSKANCVDLTHEELLQGLRNMFGQRLSTLSLRREFEKRTWKADEPLSDYVHDKVVLGNRVPIADTEIVDYIIEGIPDENIRALAEAQCFTKTEELLRAFGKMRLPTEGRRRRNLQQQRETTSTMEENDVETRKQKKSRQMRCFNCNGCGHYASDCVEPKREKGSCFKCGKRGHKAVNCKASNSVTDDNTPQDENNDDDIYSEHY